VLDGRSTMGSNLFVVNLWKSMREKLKNKDESLGTFPGPLILTKKNVPKEKQWNPVELISRQRCSWPQKLCSKYDRRSFPNQYSSLVK
ncbi:7688_t:CDS:2, partial [Ambispora leptoticha]